MFISHFSSTILCYLKVFKTRSILEEKSNVRTYLFNINIWVAIPTSTLLKGRIQLRTYSQLTKEQYNFTLGIKEIAEERLNALQMFRGNVCKGLRLLAFIPTLFQTFTLNTNMFKNLKNKILPYAPQPEPCSASLPVFAVETLLPALLFPQPAAPSA